MLKNKELYLIPALGFLLIIIFGVIFLTFPICNNGNVSTLDNIFTSVSATCVNGMSTVNISEDYTFWGQIIIAILTEIGAVGFITIISFILNIKKKRMQLSESILVSSALNENKYSKLKTRLKEVIKYTLVIELIGSIFLAIEFVPMYGINKGVWYSIFHSITAFCNAGFDLFGDAGFTIFSNNIYLNIVFIVLMLLGGIGFFVIEDIITCIKRKSILHMQFHTKIVLSTTFVLYLISIILIKIAQPNLTILQILFLSATLRTTGFSTIDMSSVSSLTKLLSSILMMIGGAPGSTSGGFRITTFAVLFLTMKSVLENKSNVIIFYKKIDTNTIKKALTNVFISCMLILVAIIVFVKIQDIGLINILFMCVSAFSATGLSVINVGSLNILAKVLLMILMFIGRVGIISFTSIFILNKKENKNIDYVTGDLIL